MSAATSLGVASAPQRSQPRSPFARSVKSRCASVAPHISTAEFLGSSCAKVAIVDGWIEASTLEPVVVQPMPGGFRPALQLAIGVDRRPRPPRPHA